MLRMRLWVRIPTPVTVVEKATVQQTNTEDADAHRELSQITSLTILLKSPVGFFSIHSRKPPSFWRGLFLRQSYIKNRTCGKITVIKSEHKLVNIPVKVLAACVMVDSCNTSFLSKSLLFFKKKPHTRKVQSFST